METFLDLFLGLLLLRFGFRQGQKRGQVGLEADALTAGNRSMDKGTGCLVEGILTNVCDASVETCHLMTGFLAVLRSFFAARKMSLVPLESFELRKAKPLMLFPGFPFSHATEKVVVGLIKVTQGILHDPLGDVLKPGEISVFSCS